MHDDQRGLVSGWRGLSRSGVADRPEPADRGRYSGGAVVPPSAAHTRPWPRPRPSRGLWPEARWSEGAAPPSRPCRTGTAAPELKRSDDPPHAPWFASATPGPSVYPQPQPSGIPADPFSRSPYDALRVKIREEALVRNKAVHVALGVRADGTKEILGLWIDGQVLASRHERAEEPRRGRRADRRRGWPEGLS